MSQNIRADPGASARHGKIWKVAGSGLASMSDSYTRAKPSIAEPSNPMPSAKAPSSSAGATATDLRNPRTSVNHSRTKRMSRSSRVRSTNSCCLSTSPVCRPGVSCRLHDARMGSMSNKAEPAPYLHLPGTAREALTLYGDVFGCAVQLHTFEAFDRTDGPPDAIAHGYLEDGPVTVFAADVA